MLNRCGSSAHQKASLGGEAFGKFTEGRMLMTSDHRRRQFEELLSVLLLVLKVLSQAAILVHLILH